jgi:biopolymer transport protein ExbB
MAGMVASISGILFTSGMDRKVGRLIQKLNDEMEID